MIFECYQAGEAGLVPRLARPSHQLRNKDRPVQGLPIQEKNRQFKMFQP